MTSQSQLEYVDGFVIKPDVFYSPSYRVSPFRTDDIASNLLLPSSVDASAYLNQKFSGRDWCFTECGKEGIALALSALHLSPKDCVTILTTSGNSYISGCVTREIEKVCSWSRDFEHNTAVIFVNHEFGYPFRDLADLKRYGVPIIEDACHSYLANTPSGDMGLVGDFIVYSLPKVYPLQMGGILSFNPRYKIQSKVSVGGGLDLYLNKVLSYYWPSLSEAKDRRLANYYGLTKRFSRLGCYPRFDLLENDVPGVFLFSVPADTNLIAMKEYGWRHGIECSIFYGEEAFFIPIHQRLSDVDLDYFYTVFARFFLEN